MKSFSLRMLFLGLCVQGGFMFTAHGAAGGGISDNVLVGIDLLDTTDYLRWAEDRLINLAKNHDGQFDAFFTRLSSPVVKGKLGVAASKFSSAIDANSLDLSAPQVAALKEFLVFLSAAANLAPEEIAEASTKIDMQLELGKVLEQFEAAFPVEFLDSRDTPETEVADAKAFLDEIMAVASSPGSADDLSDAEALSAAFRTAVAGGLDAPALAYEFQESARVLDTEIARLRAAGDAAEVARLETQRNQLRLLNDAFQKSLPASGGPKPAAPPASGGPKPAAPPASGGPKPAAPPASGGPKPSGARGTVGVGARDAKGNLIRSKERGKAATKLLLQGLASHKAGVK